MTPVSEQLGLFPDGPVGPAPADPRHRAVARRLPAGVRLGTSSWSFPGWAGIVYDRRVSEGVLARHGLPAYAAHPLLRTAGVDRTYYRPIPAGDFRRYAEAVPADFRFVVKADRLLTSPVDPAPGGVRTPNPLFLDPAYAAEAVVGPMVEGLGEKAGPLLFQFSPMSPRMVGGRDAFARRLGDFLAALPEGVTYAVELRTPALFGPAYAGALAEVGAAHCYTVHPAMSPLRRQLEVLPAYRQPVLLVRWMLHGGLGYQVARDRYEPFDGIVDEDPVTRETIAVAVLDAAVAEKDAFVVVNNKAEGSSPLSVFLLARRIAEWRAAAAGDDPT